MLERLAPGGPTVGVGRCPDHLEGWSPVSELIQQIAPSYPVQYPHLPDSARNVNPPLVRPRERNLVRLEPRNLFTAPVNARRRIRGGIGTLFKTRHQRRRAGPFPAMFSRHGSLKWQLACCCAMCSMG